MLMSLYRVCEATTLLPFFLPPVSSALFAPRMFSARPGQKSPTALHDESSTDTDKDDGINYTTVDWREFMCNTWHLEPTLRSILLRRTADIWSVFCFLFVVVSAHTLFLWRSHIESQCSFMNSAHSKPAEEKMEKNICDIGPWPCGSDSCGDAQTKHANPNIHHCVC